LELGTFTKESGLELTLTDNTASPTPIFSRNRPAITVNYTITRGTIYRTGVLNIINTATPVWTDDFVESAPTGVVLSITESAGVITVSYTTTSTGTSALFYYSVSYLPSVV
jgi:hypothetical protein